jgi:tRNA (uracil-5-)-methyltransferase TRM9
MAPKKLEPVHIEASEDPASFEAKNVHEIYDAIAAHFSSTRYKVHRGITLSGRCVFIM